MTFPHIKDLGFMTQAFQTEQEQQQQDSIPLTWQNLFKNVKSNLNICSKFNSAEEMLTFC